jgi:hypothetical protein
MRSAIQKFGHLTVAGLLCSAGLLGQTATVDLTAKGNSSMDGISVGPYTATINGVSTLVISDDYADIASVNHTWNATTAGPSNMSGATLQEYDEAAYLASELLTAYSSGKVVKEGELSFAIWSIFDPTALVNLALYDTENGTSYAVAAASYLLAAASQSDSNFAVYTPTGKAGTEFLTMDPPVPTAEPSALLLLGFDLFCVLALIFLLRRYAVRRLPQ